MKKHSLSNFMLPSGCSRTDFHANTDRLSAVNVNISTACFFSNIALKHKRWALLKCVSCSLKTSLPPLLNSLHRHYYSNWESTSHLCGSQRGGTSAFLKDHCAFLSLTAVALSWPRWMKKPWRLLTASNGACCKQTASGMHNNVMMQRRSTKSSSQFCFNVTCKFQNLFLEIIQKINVIIVPNDSRLCSIGVI